MSDPIRPSITIPATAEASSEYRVAQSEQSLLREGLRPLKLGKHTSKVFKQGVALKAERCIMTTPIDSWTPNTNHTPLQQMVHSKVEQEKINKLFGREGLAATIALTDTAAGVTEAIEYDENEVIVKPMIEEGNNE